MLISHDIKNCAAAPKMAAWLQSSVPLQPTEAPCSHINTPNTARTTARGRGELPGLPYVSGDSTPRPTVTCQFTASESPASRWRTAHSHNHRILPFSLRWLLLWWARLWDPTWVPPWWDQFPLHRAYPGRNHILSHRCGPPKSHYLTQSASLYP